MQLITILLIAISLLAVLSGVSVFAGSKKGERAQTAMFCLTTVSTLMWIISIVLFLTASTDSMELAKLYVYGIYISGLVMNIFALAYTGWGRKLGWAMIILSLIVTAGMSAILIYDPSLLYSSITLGGPDGNSVQLKMDWYYMAYASILSLENIAIVLFTWHRIRHSSSPAAKKGWLIFAIGLVIGGLGAGIFDVMLPLERYDLIWVGPLLLAADFIAHYYAVLRYHTISLHNAWLRLLSYIVIVALAAVLYFVLFFIVFSSLFSISNPSTEVIMLNFIMVAVGLLLAPAVSEINSYIQSLASTQQINLGYITKKLEKLVGQEFNPAEVSSFLADHLHLQYTAIIAGGKIYESRPTSITAEQISAISVIPTSSRSLWVSPGTHTGQLLENLDITEVIELRNDAGDACGHLLLGRPISKSLRKNDHAKLAVVAQMVATIISTKKRTRA